jgi:zinc transport system substrate-binding protein
MLKDIKVKHKKIVIVSIVLIAFALISITAFGNWNSNNEDNPGADKNKYQIITSFYPIYIATINVAKGIEGVEVTNMTRPQVGCLHDYQLTPWDLKLIESGDAFIINGAGMETFVDSLIAQNSNIQLIDASQGIKLIEDENGIKNAHVFVSISNEITQVYNIAKALSKLNPKNKEAYIKNAEEYVLKLSALKNKMHNSLKNIKITKIVTFHEAFPYFTQEFGLEIVAVIEREPGVAPTAKELVSTIDLIENNGIKTIFVEPQYPIKTANVIAQETRANVYVLDPIVTGESKSDAYDDYLVRMEKNLVTLEETLK